MADQFIGEIRIFAGSYAPRDWLFCNGAILPVSQYPALFSLLSNYYGGDGVSTFGLPDFRGRVPINQGKGPNLSNRYLGYRGGLETVKLDVQNLPNHRHTLMGVKAPATETEAVGNSFANTSGTYTFYNDAVSEQMAPLAVETVGDAGASQPHYNMMPYTVMNFIIAAQGIYPQRK